MIWTWKSSWANLWWSTVCSDPWPSWLPQWRWNWLSIYSSVRGPPLILAPKVSSTVNFTGKTAHSCGKFSQNLQGGASAWLTFITADRLSSWFYICRWELGRTGVAVGQDGWASQIQACAEKRFCIAKHQPGATKKNFLATQQPFFHSTQNKEFKLSYPNMCHAL